MTNPEDIKSVLAGDIGGTKTTLGFFVRGKGRPILKSLETYSNKDATDIGNIIKSFSENHNITVDSACFGIAGPVIAGRCKTTNLPWDVSENTIKQRFRWKNVRLINDLSATAQAIPLLTSRELSSLNRPRIRKGKNIALLAPGTGLGEAFLIFRNGQYSPVSSEGGHADFSPNNESEVKLWRYLHKRYGHVSIERLLSGPGLVNIYSWLKDSGKYRQPLWLRRKFKEMDPARVISETALENRDHLCVKALNFFVSILGAAAGNLALTGMTTGGVYLGGGIPPKILPKLKEDLFMKGFVGKGRFKTLLKKIPVRVILNDKAALYGAAYTAFNL